MHKARFTENQIIAVVKSLEAERTLKPLATTGSLNTATWKRLPVRNPPRWLRLKR